MFCKHNEWYTYCAICGRPVSIRLAEKDHIIPLSKGGHPTHPNNQQLTHSECNRAKADILPWELKNELEGVRGYFGFASGLYVHEQRQGEEWHEHTSALRSAGWR